MKNHTCPVQANTMIDNAYKLTDACALASAGLAGSGHGLLRGRVVSVGARAVEVAGLSHHLSLGDRITLLGRDGRRVPGEIVALHHNRAVVMAFEPPQGLGPGTTAHGGIGAGSGGLAVSNEWLGRVIDPLGRPLDGRGALPRGRQNRPLRAAPPDATQRGRLGPQLNLGVRALDIFTPCRRGQRLGLFAGPGVGKSTLLAMLARSAGGDVTILALVGERGREVREFLEDELGMSALQRCVVVVATSDATPLLRREAAYAAVTIAEFFRDAGRHVLLLMDSVTRFCLALREIALGAGEPPATRGYPASVFAELPRLLERAGPGPLGADAPGDITAFFTVLVEGDDFNEPVADATRGFLDGHVILDRRIAEAGRYPAIDVLRSLSRTAPPGQPADDAALVRRARRILANHADIIDLVRLGAYRAGSDPAADEALAAAPRVEAVLRQSPDETATVPESFAALRVALAGE